MFNQVQIWDERVNTSDDQWIPCKQNLSVCERLSACRTEEKDPEELNRVCLFVLLLAVVHGAEVEFMVCEGVQREECQVAL